MMLMQTMAIPSKAGLDMAEADLIQLGKRIEETRIEAGLSAREVADGAGISPAYLRALERAINPKTQKPSRPSLDALMGISKALGLDARQSGELLALAGYDASLAEESQLAGAPARRAVDDLVRQIQEAVKRLNGRSRFMYLRTQERLEEFTAGFRAMAAGTLRCSAEEEPRLTQLAVEEACRSHLRAVSYQDETWWRSDAGDRYLELHERLSERGVEMTRIFIVDEQAAAELVPTFERHMKLNINTFVLSPHEVSDYYWRDFVIYDDALLRTAVVTDPTSERKLAEFTDDPGRIAQALEDFKALHRVATAKSATVEAALTRIGRAGAG